MNQKLRYLRQRSAVAWLVPLLCACGSDADFDYALPTDAQLQEIEAIWRERALSPRGVALVFQSDNDANYQLRIYEHVVEGRKHYGAVTIPKSDAQPAFPVVLFADGLNQFAPRMDVSGWIRATRPLLDRAVLVFPAFRGRALTYEALTSDAESDFYRGLTFAAEGDFCDAYVPVSVWTPGGPVAERASCASEVTDGSTTKAQQAGVEADRSGVAAVRAA